MKALELTVRDTTHLHYVADGMSLHKRLTDAELAAEWHQQDNYTAQRFEGYRQAHDGHPMGSEEDEAERLRTLHRFATLPHYDEPQP